mgnify:CR=1 FL=1
MPKFKRKKEQIVNAVLKGRNVLLEIKRNPLYEAFVLMSNISTIDSDCFIVYDPRNNCLEEFSFFELDKRFLLCEWTISQKIKYGAVNYM